MSTAAPATPRSPQQRLRDELAGINGRLFLVGAVLAVWLLDTVLSHRLADSGAVDGKPRAAMVIFENVSTVLFIVISVALIACVIFKWNHAFVPLAVTYLAFSVVQVAVNVFSLVISAGHQADVGLAGLWDVAAVYIMTVLVFTFVYALMDIQVPGGAFVWPGRDGEEPPTPNLVDYLFISLNTNATYGPTTEAVMSRKVKLMMALQVIMALLMLTVLIARSVAATT